MASSFNFEKGCWTCKDRKVACDRLKPSCRVCTKTKRTCAGYGMRLSWPRPNDRKRFVMSSASQSTDTRFALARHFLHCSPWDVELHDIAATNGEPSRPRPLISPLPPNYVPWFHPKPLEHAPLLRTKDEELLCYFESTVVSMLPVFDDDPERLVRVLLRLALTRDTAAASAVRHAMLALSSLYRDGENQLMARHKLKSLDMLVISLEQGVNRESAIMHIAAGILLCTVEMNQVSLNASQWIGHICCTQGVARVLESEIFEKGGDESAILAWALYYDVLARFSVRHWRTADIDHIAHELRFDAAGCEGCALQYTLAQNSFALRLPNLSQHGHPVLGLLSEACETSLYSHDTRYHTEAYQTRLKALAQRLKTVVPHLVSECDVPHNYALTQVKLFRLVTLIYFERTSKNFSGYSEELEDWINDGFQLLCHEGAGRWPFPIFVLACEARTDIRRLTILNLIDESFQLDMLHHTHVLTIKAMIQRAWIQDDLLAGGDLEYIRKLHLIMSSSAAVPIFV